jgi:hypothetical protein
MLDKANEPADEFPVSEITEGLSGMTESGNWPVISLLGHRLEGTLSLAIIHHSHPSPWYH